MLSQIQLQIIQGSLLGDGSLTIHKNGKNAYFNYTCISEELINDLCLIFSDFTTDSNKQAVKNQYFDIRTNKTYIRYTFKTKALPIFTDIYHQWYKNKIKDVPDDLILTPLICQYWYIGDGELEKKNGYIKLHTNSFSLKTVELLKNQLFKFDCVFFHKQKEQYILTIPHKQTHNFLSYIGHSIYKFYDYKWLQIHYKNKKIQINGFKYHNYTGVEELYKNGITIYAISKQKNIPIAGIKNYFNKSNINWNPVVKKILK